MSELLNDLKSATETVPEIYDDALKPATKEAGKTLSLIPRAINAALAPLQKWIARREYSVKEVEKLLAQKLENVDVNKIVSPDAYVAVPALQAISYCMSNKELYNLFSNLLSKSMHSDYKQKVHPAFVEILKQFSPNDALVLKEIFNSSSILGAASLAIVLKPRGLHHVNSATEVKYSTDMVYDIHCSSLSEDEICISVNNLDRLGMITFNSNYCPLDIYFDFVKNTSLYSEFQKMFDELKGTEEDPDHIEIEKSSFSLSAFGQLFCEICILGID